MSGQGNSALDNSKLSGRTSDGKESNRSAFKFSLLINVLTLL
jgi:hypothetical protein